MNQLENLLIRAVGASAIAACALASACVTEPFDGENVASSPIVVLPKIAGWGDLPGQSVTIYAKNAGGGFDEVGDTSTVTSGLNWSGKTWYSWQILNMSLPTAYWTNKPNGCGRTATLKAQIGDTFAASLDQPYDGCWDIDQTVEEFLVACQSDNSPNITIDTCGLLCC